MSVFLLALSRELGAAGHRVDLFTRRVRPEDAAVEALSPGVELVRVDVPGVGQLPKEALLDHAEAFAEAIDAHRRLLGVDYDVIHSHYWISGVVGRHLARRWGCRHLITFHTLGAAKQTALDGHREPATRLREEARLALECDGIVVPTELERALVESHCGAQVRALHVVPCGVELRHFHPEPPRVVDGPIGRSDARRHRRDASHGPTLLFVGRLDAMKGLETLLDAMARLDPGLEARLIVAGGDGPDSQGHRELTRRVEAVGLLARVELSGPVAHDQMPALYREVDAVVVPSRYESFGLVILEALACGTPVVCTPVGVAPEVIRPGFNGQLAPIEDPAALALAITRVLSLARERDPWTIRASVESYSWERMASSLQALYRLPPQPAPTGHPPEPDLEGTP